jgi:hypothetical protein
MDNTPYLHVPVPHAEKLADLLVLPPIFPLTNLRTIQGGLAYSAVLELHIRRCSDFANDAAPEHDCCWVRVRQGGAMYCSVMQWMQIDPVLSVPFRMESTLVLLVFCEAS